MAHKHIIKIVDGAFKGAYGLGFSGANGSARPAHIIWDRSESNSDTEVIVFTDSHLEEARQSTVQKKIGLLIESPGMRPAIYAWIRANYHLFDVVFTHQRDLAEMGEPFRFMTLGGSRIPLEEWGIYPKHRLVNIVASDKTKLPGHRIRHMVTRLDGVDAYGPSYIPLVQKSDLKHYYFSIVTENCNLDWYFTEKLIDAFALGILPIYWGCDVSKFFDMDGIITFDTVEGLAKLIPKLTPEFYHERMDAVMENYKLAHSYRCPEDCLWENHLGVFV